MTLVLIGFVGGLITGVSPCILPVLPVIFLSGGVKKSPYLVVAGLTLSFSVFTLLGTLLLSVLPLPSGIIRWAGLVVLVLLGVGMIVPRVEHLLERPFSRIPQRRVETDRGALVMGIALGAVYVPCAGPVLAAITVAGATGKIGGQTVVLTLSFAVGTAIPLLFFALAGRGLSDRLTAFREHQRAIRTAAGVVVIALAVALTFNITDVIQRAVPDYTAALTAKTNQLGGNKAACSGEKLADCGTAPAIEGIAKWLNTPKPIDLANEKGKVVLVDFWAYSCINCQRAIAHVNAWYSTYEKDGFEVIGVHTPEYAFEHDAGNVAAGAKRLGIHYPIALDNDYATWNNYSNESWPADYLIDATGQVRFTSVGEGKYPQTEALIRSLLTSADPTRALPKATQVADRTPTMPVQSPETYLGAERAQYFNDATTLSTGTKTYTYPKKLQYGAFALTGTWDVGNEALTSKAQAGIELSYLANDIYLDVGGTGTLTATVDGKTTTYQVSGAPNIYRLLHRENQGEGVIKVDLSPGLSAYSFTFG